MLRLPAGGTSPEAALSGAASPPVPGNRRPARHPPEVFPHAVKPSLPGAGALPSGGKGEGEKRA